VYDADMIVNLEEGMGNGSRDPEKLKTLIEKSFLTETGRQLARKTFLITESAENTEKRI
jgi:hypothetical protein